MGNLPIRSRICRVSLGVRRTQNSIRTVPKLAQPDDGSAKAGRPPVEVLYLDSRDLRVFKHAYLCAVYPVLAAPSPPSPVSPSPRPTFASASRRSSGSSGAVGGTEVHPAARSSGARAADVFVTCVSPLSHQEPAPHSSQLVHGSPYTFHDSGVEESDEAGLIGLIPMESICQQLQRAFGLSGALFRQYEVVIVRAYSKAKKSSQKVLAEELTGQLAILENNSHPFYAPNHFITRNGYDLWQKQERMHISELLAKFWQQSLPLLRDHQDRIAELQGVHEDYQILLRKLLDYESKFRDETDGTSALTFTPLSSASCRLLLEFGLRYGIGEMFRKTVLLQNLISEFSPTVGYVTYVNNLVLSIKCMLPSNKAVVVMVKQELDVLHSSLRVLKTQTCKALNQMKDLFSDSRPANGIGLLLSLLKSVMSLMAYLAPSNAQHESYRSCVYNTVMGIFRPHYGKIKAAVWADCDQGRGEQISPQMLNIIIVDIISEVADFRNNFEGAFQKFFSISKMAAVSFYHFLMEDVDVFCQSAKSGKVTIDRQTLALAYRLNQLDSEWGSFIIPRYQTWRVSFLPKLDEWTSALKLIAQQFIVKAVATDQYLSQKIELPQPLLTYQDPSLLSERNSCSISVVSITPSVNSAFSSIMSSIRSTPCHAPQPNGAPDPGTNMQSMFLRKLPTPNIKIDQATGVLLQEKEPVTFTSSSLDSKILKPSKSQGNFYSQPRVHDFVSLPDHLDERNVSDQRSKGGFDMATSISAWREEVAKHRPLPMRPQSQAGSTEREEDGHRSNEAVVSASWSADKTALCDRSNTIASTGKSQPSLFIPPSRYTPASSDGDETKGSASTVDHGAFSFPPLSIESYPAAKPETVDFSQPVFQRPQSGQSASHRRGQGTSALDPATSPSTLLDRQNLSSFDMVGSNSTITITDTREAVLSTSGSVVDVIVLLQRLCGFSANLLGIILSRDRPQCDKPKTSLTRLRSKESFSESVERDSKSRMPPDIATKTASKRDFDEQSFATSSCSEVQAAGSLPGFTSWSTFTTSFSSTQSYSGHPDDIDRLSKASGVKAIDEKDATLYRKDSQDSSTTDFKRDPRHAVVRTPSRIGQAQRKASLEELEPEPTTKTFSKLRTRLKLHLQILKTMCNILTVYTTNILCMDLCGTPKAVAKKLIGANLVDFVRKQQEDGVVWGCRHQGEVPYGCLYYFNRRVDYLCERYEPVTQHMCTRINNAFACLYLLDEYCDHLTCIFGLEEDGQAMAEEDEDFVERSVGEEGLQVKEEPPLTASGRSDGSGDTSTGANSLFEVISSSSGYLTSDANPGHEQGGSGDTQQFGPSASKPEAESYVSSEDDSLSDTACAVPLVSLKHRWTTRVQQTYLAARHHVLATVSSMCRLMAHKLNLFVRDGLPMLLRLKDPAVTMDSCLSPIITFMHRYLDSLSSWLYRDCFRRVLDYLWVLIVQVGPVPELLHEVIYKIINSAVYMIQKCNKHNM
ncbi:hypothetical protein ElyMa_002920600 [Elysia marginata]|uniref:Uncharacterized protein n=1 Tax=Elysia marginata TaxID=1093978 RepID=A0AAV4I5P0_9GAST|nr:hypothetical protein ElyMa_002920600 [Elysia marginata]